MVVLVLYLLYARHIAHRLSRLSIASEELPQTRPARSSARREPIVPVVSGLGFEVYAGESILSRPVGRRRSAALHRR